MTRVSRQSGRKHLLLAALLVPLLAGTAPAQADTGNVEMSVALDGEHQLLTQCVVIAAPPSEVWAAFATEEGYTAWAVRHAKIDLRTGGIMETSYAPEFVVGDPKNIKNQIIAFVPERLMVLKNVQAPPGFAPRETLDRLTSVLEFEAQGEVSTKVTIHGIGYGTDAESEKLIEFFKAGNAWSFEQLKKLFAE